MSSLSSPPHFVRFHCAWLQLAGSPSPQFAFRFVFSPSPSSRFASFSPPNALDACCFRRLCRRRCRLANREAARQRGSGSGSGRAAAARFRFHHITTFGSAVVLVLVLSLVRCSSLRTQKICLKKFRKNRKLQALRRKKRKNRDLITQHN